MRMPLIQMNLGRPEPERYGARMNQPHFREEPDRATGPLRVAGDPEMAALCTKLRYSREHFDAIGHEFERIVDQIDTIFSGKRIHLPPTAIEKAQEVRRNIDESRSALRRLLAVFGIEPDIPKGN